ncbi:hypothetical protein FGB62_59g053 [Gracilaria domingensis]|nr:hypothetical protein FGB62_59g053 [Gracilaria domingensis]
MYTGGSNMGYKDLRRATRAARRIWQRVLYNNRAREQTQGQARRQCSSRRRAEQVRGGGTNDGTSSTHAQLGRTINRRDHTCAGAQRIHQSNAQLHEGGGEASDFGGGARVRALHTVDTMDAAGNEGASPEPRFLWRWCGEIERVYDAAVGYMQARLRLTLQRCHVVALLFFTACLRSS